MNKYQEAWKRIKYTTNYDVRVFDDNDEEIKLIQELVDSQDEIKTICGYDVNDLVVIAELIKRNNITPEELSSKIDLVRVGITLQKEAQEQAIAKQINGMFNGMFKELKPEYEDRCPNCDGFNIRSEEQNNRFKFCPDCGQALDWSKDEI